MADYYTKYSFVLSLPHAEAQKYAMDLVCRLIDHGAAFVSVREEVLTDGSKVWNIHFRSGDTLHPKDEATADAAFTMIAEGLRTATNGDVLIL